MGKFSILISVYAKEKAHFLRVALESIWDTQTLKPNEIVLVKDGPLTKELDEVIREFGEKAPLKIITLEQNKGLGYALAIGLENCSNEIIARMDSDDIASAERFEKQISYLMKFKEISLLSSSIAEFNSDPSITNSIRKVPEHHNEIQKFAKKRNPMNHMAVMFKKTAVLDAGNYQPFHGYEDYFLWVRMLQKGYKAANINENLIHARIGNNMLARRQGIKFFKEELRLQNEFLKMKFINRFEWLQNVVLRALPRLLPISLLKIVYKTLRK